MRFPKSARESRYWKNFFLNQLKELEDKDKIIDVLKYHDFKYYEEFVYLQESIKDLCKHWINFLYLLNETWEYSYMLKNKTKNLNLIICLQNTINNLKFNVNVPKEGVTGRSYIMYMKNFIELNIKYMIKVNKYKLLSYVPVCE